MRQANDLIHAWRILAAYSDEGGLLRPVAVDWKAVSHTDRPVIAVVRIDGRLDQINGQRWQSQIDRLLSLLRRSDAKITGLEIDYDCGTASLREYAKFLELVRSHLEPAMRLSITALPAWLLSPDLGALFAPVSETILQVHMVQQPHSGLFDPDAAHQWIRTMSRRTTKPFRVALPNYGVRVSWREDGSMLSVEGERPLLAGGSSATEMTVPPKDVAALLKSLEDDPPPSLAGFVWFRLPVPGDIREWSFNTWRAVVLGKPLDSRIEALAQKSNPPGMSKIVLINRGSMDSELPDRIGLPPSCRIADGINGYSLEYDRSGLAIKRQQAGLLPAHQQRLIGWMRCTPAQVVIHAEF
ncbi:MAG TPA: DUF3142 domain-containing protein [Candidatus Binataceae bacterium]|nr:DUF3142 domain-containing protein [Candidatus Binataceae bacterium]